MNALLKLVRKGAENDRRSLIERLKLTLEYIESAAASGCTTDELAARTLAGIRNVAQEMIKEYKSPLAEPRQP